MKRVICATTKSSNSKYVISVFNGEGKFIGYLFDYIETKGHSVVKCTKNARKAVSYDSASIVNRAYGYYQHFSEIYVYDGSTIPSHKYKVFKQGVDPSSFNTSDCAYHSIEGSYLKVTEV